MARANLPRNRSQTGVEAIRDNNLYAANLSAALHGLGKKVLAAYAATMLDVAIRETKHDSSRFAANWGLVVNRVGLSTELNPAKYGESVETGGRIGKKGSQGEFRENVRKAKGLFYGYRDGPAGLQESVPGGRLYVSLGVGQKGTPPRVELVNPAIDNEHPRRDGFGATYVQNALGGDLGNLVSKVNLHDTIAGSFIPQEITRYRLLIRTAMASHTLFSEG